MVDRDLAFQISQDVKWVKDDVIELKRSWLDPVKFIAWLVLICHATFKVDIFYLQTQKEYKPLFETWEIIFLAIVFILANLPKGRPVRIDRKRQLIYFSYWGKFYIKHYHANRWVNDYLPFNIRDFSGTVRGSSYFYQRLEITLPSEDNSHNTHIRLSSGSSEIKDFVYQFTNYQISNETVKSIIKSGWKPIANKEFYVFIYSALMLIGGITLFPNFGYNEKRTEKKIKAWLKKYYEE